MFRELRRKEKQLSIEDTLNILKEGTYGILGTIGEDGYPYSVPLNFVYINNNIYFHCASEGHKLDNIKYNNKVSFTIVSKSNVIKEKFSTEYKSVILFGKISKVYKDEKRKALVEFINKFSPGYKEKGNKFIEKFYDDVEVLKINIENITGKGNGA